jgi:hypothetical protein
MELQEVETTSVKLDNMIELVLGEGITATTSIMELSPR